MKTRGYQRRADDNHSDVCQALRKIGCSVLDLSRVGGGCPDILVARLGKMWLMEIKTEKGKLNAKQERFHRSWNTDIYIVRSPLQAIEIVQSG